MYSQQILSNSKPQSYLSPHPQIIKKLSNTPTPKLQIPQQQYNKKRQEFYYQQQKINSELKDKLQSLQHQNTLFKDSLIYFDPTQILSQLEKQLTTIKNKQLTISKQIEHCEAVEKTTTPQQYFLFKKNRRLESFNQAINEIYEGVDKEKQGLRQAMEKLMEEMSEVKGEIQRMQGELNNNNNRQDGYEMQRRQQEQENDRNSQVEREQNQLLGNTDKTKRESICQSRINVIVESTLSVHQHQHQPNKQTINNEQLTSLSQSSQSSIQPYQLQHLKQQYKSLLETYEIISQNNQIMTTQLFNNIDSIQDSLYKYYDTQTNKLYRDLLLIKEDFSYMPLQHIIPPTQTQLNYTATPLIQDYKNKLIEIKNKLSTDLKKITTDILTPLQWENISIQQYLHIDSNQDDDKSTQNNYLLKSSQNQNLKQTLKQHQKIQTQIKKQNQIIGSLQSQLQQIMGDTMVFKQKQHQLQFAINNMRKLLRQQQQSNQTILF